VVQNEAGSLTLAEEGGGTLKLTQRALPYMPLSISGKQRAEFNWYPGNPQATVQMLGPEEQTITLKGFWKDKFIQGTTAAQFISAEVNALRAALSTNSTTSASVRDVASLVKIVDNMRRMGRRIVLQWDKLIRYGHIIGFTQTWHTPHYCEWELEFAVAALEEPRVAASTPNQTNLGDAAVQAAEWAKELERAKVAYKPATVVLAPEVLKALNEFENNCIRTSNYIGGGASYVAQAISLGPNITRSVISSLAGVGTNAVTAAGAVFDVALTEVFAIGTFTAAGVSLVTGETNSFREDSLPFGVQLGAASYQRGLKNQCQTIAYSTAVTRWAMQQQLQDELKASFTAKQDMDLRDVSTQFYGTPDNWRDLLIYNGLTSSRLTAGQLIWVPQQGYSAGAGFTQGGGY